MTPQPRVDLLESFPPLKRLLSARSFQPVMTLMTLLVFTLAVLTSLLGTPVGSRNFGIIFVWIVWWALLIVVLVPLTGRFWCSFCPIPAPGEWLQRRGIIQRTPGRLRTLGRRWPRRFRNMWLQNFGFLLVATFSAIILTRPQVSGLVLLSFVLAAVALSVIFDNRVFCRYVCPVGGFIGLYAMVAPIEVRTKDCQTCKTHRTKDCVTGNEKGYGCPWMVYPGNLERNAYCGMCMECLKSCPQDNVSVFWRPVGSDLLLSRHHRLDEAYKALIMLACALLYSTVFGGPWGWVKQWANMESLPSFGLYAVVFWTANLLVLPGIFLGVTALVRRLGRQQLPLRSLFEHYAYALVPLGLAAWIAFSLGFVFTNGSYAATVISDPFGWGWNLFGTANIPWAPLLPSLTSFLQVGVLIAGLLFAVNLSYRLTLQNSSNRQYAFRALLPLVGFLTTVTVAFLWLYLG
jgi:ferredoxin